VTRAVTGTRCARAVVAGELRLADALVHDAASASRAKVEAVDRPRAVAAGIFGVTLANSASTAGAVSGAVVRTGLLTSATVTCPSCVANTRALNAVAVTVAVRRRRADELGAVMTCEALLANTLAI